MIQKVLAYFKQAPLRSLFYVFWTLATGLTALIFSVMGKSDAAVVALVFGGGVMVAFACRPSSDLYRITVGNTGWRGLVCAALVLVVTVFACVRPMSEFDLWNGENPGHRNQYEKMAEAILDGKLYLEYGGEEELAALQNPYDPKQRDEAGVWYQWDHAFYEGHYYMYFGVVPVLTTFVPYLAITGESLTTYRATAWFTALIAAGLFALFYLLARRFFPRLPLCVYLTLSVAFSLMSVWFACAEPALYCTAITSAVAMMVWSIFFFVAAVYIAKRENIAILLAGIGALFGALAFGCRPTVALANVVVIPLLIVFLRGRKFSLKLLGKLCLAALPYVVVAAGLMWYNYVRFDDPFEFGQAYQLTVADQTGYGFTVSWEEILRLYNETVHNFFGYWNIGTEFPFVSHCGALMNFPILFLIGVAIYPATRKSLKHHHLYGLTAVLALSVVLITLFQIMWTPYLLERYRMDIYFLLGILCFLAVGVWCGSEETPERRGRRSLVLMVLGAVTMVCAVLLCVREIGYYYPDFVAQMKESIPFLK